ncbi:MAG: ATP-dependent helicase HrpB [Hirschia sp.]|nr:ATP-dependent helicase HrpB [Hirschia sp.]MBF18774.1 ATP-dependent helicase HrpB [Hirschia sp.]
MKFDAPLPIDDVLDAIRDGLRNANRLVLAAPPGAGKTTRVPLALLDEDWAQAGRIIVLEPRRIAARAAATRMASTLNQKVGDTIGLRARMDVRISKATRIEVVTEGVFTRMILDDPELSGVSAVLFDEFHERSLDADLGLALALEAQEALREDLRIMPMSATLDVGTLGGFLGCEVIASEGRAYPVETRHIPIAPRARLEDETARVIRQALREETGSLLVFLPGAAEISRTAERLSDLPDDILITPLFGGLTPAEQDAAIRPPPEGKRKVVIATDIAESSLTIDGVRVVIDAGLARVPRFDAQLGSTRLETIRASRANADQRRGRAGRTEPGVCYRMWDEAQTRGLPQYPDPEILQADLTGLVLDTARWGAASAEDLNWLSPPPRGAWSAAVDMLEQLGALTDGKLTETGKQIAAFPLPPRLAAMVINAAADDHAILAAQIAAVMSERGLGGRSIDLRDRLARFRTDKSARARAMTDLAKRWAKLAGGNNGTSNTEETGPIIARGFPDRIARARPGKPGEFLLANGRAGRVDADDRLAIEPWLAIAELTGGAAILRIQLAAPISEAEALEIGGVETVETASYDPDLKRLTARRVTRLGAITLSETPLPKPSGAAAKAALLDVVRKKGLAVLPCADALAGLTARIAFLHARFGADWPEDFAADLMEKLDDWLAPMLDRAYSFDGLTASKAVAAARTLLDWSLIRQLDQLAPTDWTTPTDRQVSINYQDERGPRVSAKAQEFFGLTTHPMLADGTVALGLEMLSPAQRPIALTHDIANFWTGGYIDMRKDMRGRYPKHDWPEDPANAKPQRGVKRRKGSE